MRTLIIFICPTLVGCSTAPAEQSDLIITNVNLVDGTVNPLSINTVIKNGRVQKRQN